MKEFSKSKSFVESKSQQVKKEITLPSLEQKEKKNKFETKF